MSNIKFTDQEQQVLYVEVRKLINIYNDIMLEAPTAKTAEICNCLIDIEEKIRPVLGIANVKQ